ncbi:hypothetical protein LCD36_20975 [Saccharopolyspora sp. 6T]|uniref:hypothetical protein n=1 Tax=Saccharopolyspora sp. 6T TaxID=2877238 RepID=UPI001CD23DD5|nr:hypothetical protein [Saccharopolyspora sp. 6T]MCA1188899.1 hypothetical protein [Saccharopolyspora sp. 6T]
MAEVVGSSAELLRVVGSSVREAEGPEEPLDSVGGCVVGSEVSGGDVGGLDVVGGGSGSDVVGGGGGGGFGVPVSGGTQVRRGGGGGAEPSSGGCEVLAEVSPVSSTSLDAVSAGEVPGGGGGASCGGPTGRGTPG